MSITEPSLDTAEGTLDAASAWTIWKCWRGPPALLCHVIRTGVHGLVEETGRDPMCEIRVHVADDVERFDSPADFKTDVTPQALAKFTVLEVEICDAERALLVALRLVRKPNAKDDWLRRGAMLETVATNGDQDQAERVHRQIAVAVSRGAGKDGELEADAGTPPPRTPETVLRARTARQRRGRWLSAVTILVVAAIWIAFTQPWTWREPSGDFDWASLIALVGGAVIGGLPALVITWLSPVMEVSDSPRFHRTVRFLLTIIGPIVGVIGVALKLGGNG